MPNRNIERLEFTMNLGAGVTTEHARIPFKSFGTTNVAAKRIIGVFVDVKVAANGTGSLAIGTSGDPNGYMTTANCGLGSTGRKIVASGALAAMNGVASNSEIQFESVYTRGTDSANVVFTVILLLMEEAAYQDLIGPVAITGL
jgi:hypothetical protein